MERRVCDWPMKDSTIVALAFLALCGLILICLTVMVSCGRDGALVNAFIGIAAICFGGNLWSLVLSKRK